MLTAATIVDRRLARNRKIVRIANRAPRPPSLSSPSRDSMMNEDRSDVDGVRRAGLGHRHRQRGLHFGLGRAGERITGGRDAGDLDRAEVPDRDRLGHDGSGRGRWGAGSRRGARDGSGRDAGNRRNGRRCGDAHDEALDLLDAAERPDRGHGGVRRVVPDLTGREGQVVGRQHAGHLGGRDAVGGQLVRVQGDQDPLLLAAGHVDAGDALDRQQLRRDLVLDDAGRIGELVLGVRDNRRDDHGRGVDVERADLGLDGLREPGALEVLLDLGQRRLDVGPVLELGHDEGERVRGRGLHPLEARHAGDRALHGLRHLLGDVRGARAGQGHDHGDDRELDVGQELLLEAAPGADAGDEQGTGEQEGDAPLGKGEL
jgi:hypothetical protein